MIAFACMERRFLLAAADGSQLGHEPIATYRCVRCSGAYVRRHTLATTRAARIAPGGFPAAPPRLTEALDLTTPPGRAMAGLLAIFSEFEREIRRSELEPAWTPPRTGCSPARGSRRPEHTISPDV